MVSKVCETLSYKLITTIIKTEIILNLKILNSNIFTKIIYKTINNNNKINH